MNRLRKSKVCIVFERCVLIVSQSEAVEAISQEGLQVVGWYHSHPTFLPNPSQQDLFTQTSMQRWLTEKTGAPFVGLILSPYGPNVTNLASIYRYNKTPA